MSRTAAVIENAIVFRYGTVLFFLERFLGLQKGALRHSLAPLPYYLSSEIRTNFWRGAGVIPSAKATHISFPLLW
jgi:hypothetical protein